MKAQQTRTGGKWCAYGNTMKVLDDGRIKSRGDKLADETVGAGYSKPRFTMHRNGPLAMAIRSAGASC